MLLLLRLLLSEQAASRLLGCRLAKEACRRLLLLLLLGLAKRSASKQGCPLRWLLLLLALLRLAEQVCARGPGVLSGGPKQACACACILCCRAKQRRSLCRLILCRRLPKSTERRGGALLLWLLLWASEQRSCRLCSALPEQSSCLPGGFSTAEEWTESRHSE